MASKAEADEQVGLAAAHRLLEVEDGLRRSAREPRDALGDEVLHALRDVRLLEEGRAVALGGDQLVELLDLVAELDRQRIGLELAGIANGFHSCFPRLPKRQFVCIHFNTTESGTRAALWGARAIGKNSSFSRRRSQLAVVNKQENSSSRRSKKNGLSANEARTLVSADALGAQASLDQLPPYAYPSTVPLTNLPFPLPPLPPPEIP